MKKRKLIARRLLKVAKELVAFEGTREFVEMRQELNDIRKQIGLKDRYKLFTVSLGIMTHPSLSVFGGIKWDLHGTVDHLDAGQFGEEIADVSRKVKNALELFKRNHHEAKIVKYPN